MKSLIVLIAVLLIGQLFFFFNSNPNKFDSNTNQEEAEKAYIEWKKQYKSKARNENIQEQLFRKMVFIDNYRMIESHNSNPERTYDMGLTQFMELTQDEFVNQYLTTISPPQEENESDYSFYNKIARNRPESIDWRIRGAVTAVKNQGASTRSTAYSCTGNIEGITKIFMGQLQTISEFCIKDAAMLSQAFEFVKKNGIDPVGGETDCKNGKIKIKDYQQAKSCDELLDAVSIEPVSVHVDAQKWAYYTSGIFSDCKAQVNHAVLVVGYTPQFYIIKNSWGINWGEKGYIRLAPGNTCGVCTLGMYGIY